MVPYLRAANVKDGRLDLTDVKSMNFTPQEQAVFSLRPGDVLITEGAGSLAAVGTSAVWNGEIEGTVCFQNTLLRLRPRGDTDARFLAWWARHAYASGLFGSVAGGANILHLGAERVRGLPSWVPLTASQSLIAGFLDAESVRIDSLVVKKRQLALTLQEHLDARCEEVIWTDVSGPAPLMYRTDPSRPIMYGIVLPGPNVPAGVSIVKGGDVAERRLDPALLNKTTVEIEAPYARARLRGDDLVFAIRGGIGDVEQVPSELDGANITQDVARVAPAWDVDPRWLRLVLRTPTVRRQVGAGITGATIKGINIWDLKRVRVPMSDRRRQGIDLETLLPYITRLDSAHHVLSCQVGALQEHRQALISAAVTGSMEFPGAAA
jgi:type I restriction enzyme S subunit